MIEERLPGLLAVSKPVTHILYHQGERDTLLKTNRNDYANLFEKLHSVLRQNFPKVPVIVCTASYRMGITSEEVRAGQAIIQSTLPGCVVGPDTDQFGENSRHDNTHLGNAGQETFALAISKLLAGPSSSMLFPSVAV